MQVMANEEVDPAVLIKLLRQEVQDLREEIRYTAHLTDAESNYRSNARGAINDTTYETEHPDTACR